MKKEARSVWGHDPTLPPPFWNARLRTVLATYVENFFIIGFIIGKKIFIVATALFRRKHTRTYEQGHFGKTRKSTDVAMFRLKN